MSQETAQLPQDLPHWMPLILGTLFVVLVFITSLAVVQHQVDDQYITSDELRQSLDQLQSYSQEGRLLAQYTLQKSSPSAYTLTYASSLRKATDDISQKLTEHAHAKVIDENVAATLQLASNLSGYLDELSKQPREQLPGDLPKQLDTLTDRVQQLEQRV